MGTRITDEERIVAWFTAAEPAAAQTMFRVIKGVMSGKGIDTAKKRKTKKIGQRIPDSGDPKPGA